MTYLLVLSERHREPYWQPLLMAYGIFQEEVINGGRFFIPTAESRSMHTWQRPDGQTVEPMVPMVAQDLLQHLSGVLQGKVKWEQEEVKVDPTIANEVDLRAPPGHCTYLGNYTRYTDFPGTTVTIYSEDDGDLDFSPPSDVSVQVQEGIQEMNTEYGGISITFGGIEDYTPNNCTLGAVGGNYTNLYTYREGLIQFNDPCDEIEMDTCVGTLAFGGVYTTGGTHQFDNITWNTVFNSFVVMNDSVFPCLGESDYKIVLIHELTHGLGIGHIGGEGTANMNAFCCVDISSLDIDCPRLHLPTPGSAG